MEKYNSKLVKISPYLTPQFETPDTDSFWFGYYNYDPLSKDKTRLLCGKACVDGTAPQKGDIIDIGYFDLFTGEWHKVGESDSWNWQQGAMEQWLQDDEIIFNKSKGNHLCSEIHNIVSGGIRAINWPVYGITPDGGQSITLDLERSYWCRAYHYQSVINEQLKGKVIEDDGIFSVNLHSGVKKRIISIKDVINTDWSPEFESAQHWLEHIMISPSGSKFCFLHRFSLSNNVYSYKTRLFIADIDGANLVIVGNWKNQDWSHFGWANDDSFAIYAYEHYRRYEHRSFSQLLPKHPFRALLKLYNGITYRYFPYFISRFLNGKRLYYQFYSLNEHGVFENTSNLETTFFNIDGHPSFTRDAKYMVTDSYPDRKGFQRIIIYNTLTKKGIVVAKLFAGLKETPASCDLHPKLNRDNSLLCVDTAYDGRHHMIVFKINWDLVQLKIG